MLFLNQKNLNKNTISKQTNLVFFGVSWACKLWFVAVKIVFVLQIF